MANAENNENDFVDLGFFSYVETSKIEKIKLYKIKFTKGAITLTKNEFEKILKSMKGGQKQNANANL